MSSLIILYAAGAVSLAGFMYFRTKKADPKSLLLKTLTSLIFIITAGMAFYLTNYSRPDFFALIVIGLACGLIGDIVLDLKMMYKESDAIYTYSGFTAFFIGHIFYIYANCILFEFNWLAVPIAAVVTALIVGGAPMLKLKFGKFLIPVVAYSLLLVFFTANSLINAINAKIFTDAAWLTFAGAAAFLVSDLILSMTYFGGKNNGILIISNHAVYYAAQFALATVPYLMVMKIF